MANVKSIINMYNKEVITEKKTVTTSEFRNYHGKIYYGASEGTFKQRYGNYKKSFNHEKHRRDTECSKKYLRLNPILFEVHVFLFISNRNFENRLGDAYGKSLFSLKVCLHYAYSLKFY